MSDEISINELVDGAYINRLENELDKKDKVIDLMAEDMATDYHSKEWVINYYMEKINEFRGSN